jgi:hypothetical protein
MSSSRHHHQLYFYNKKYSNIDELIAAKEEIFLLIFPKTNWDYRIGYVMHFGSKFNDE